MSSGGGTQTVTQTQEVTPAQAALSEIQLGQAMDNRQLSDLASQLLLGVGLGPQNPNTTVQGPQNQGPATNNVGPQQGTTQTQSSGQSSNPDNISFSPRVGWHDTVTGARYGNRDAAMGAVQQDFDNTVSNLLGGTGSGGGGVGNPNPINPDNVQVDPIYGEDRVADFNPAQQRGQNMAVNTANTQAGNINSTVDEILQFGLRDVLNPNNQLVQDAIGAAINPLQERLQQQILPGMSSAAQQQGAFGGSRQALLETQALDDFTENAGDISSRIALDAYNQGLDTFSRTSALMPTLEQSRYMPADALNQVGGVQQQQQQNEINADMQAFNEAVNADEEALFNLVNIMGGLNTGLGGIGFGGSTNSTTSGGGPSTLQNVAGGAMTGYAAGGALGNAMGGASFGPWGALIGGLLGAFA